MASLSKEGKYCRLLFVDPIDGRRKTIRTGITDQKNSPRQLSPATASKRLANAGPVFNDAVRRKLIEANPFRGIARPPANNPELDCYVPVEVIEWLIEDFAPDAQWRPGTTCGQPKCTSAGPWSWPGLAQIPAQ